MSDRAWNEHAGPSGTGYAYDNAAGDEDNWLISYSDLLTNLLAFFVLLFAVSKVQSYRFELVTSSFSQKPRPTMSSLRAQLDTLIDDESLRGDLETTVDDKGLALRFKTKLLFDSASARLSPEGEALLGRVVVLLEPYLDRYEIAVEGHADDLPIHTSEFASNWELSAQRSVNVVKRLIELGVDRDRVSAEAFADTRPEAVAADARDLEATRAHNRRVVMRIH